MSMKMFLLIGVIGAVVVYVAGCLYVVGIWLKSWICDETMPNLEDVWLGSFVNDYALLWMVSMVIFAGITVIGLLVKFTWAQIIVGLAVFFICGSHLARKIVRTKKRLDKCKEYQKENNI
jgi:hypothetical protein